MKMPATPSLIHTSKRLSRLDFIKPLELSQIFFVECYSGRRIPLPYVGRQTLPRGHPFSADCTPDRDAEINARAAEDRFLHD